MDFLGEFIRGDEQGRTQTDEYTTGISGSERWILTENT